MRKLFFLPLLFLSVSACQTPLFDTPAREASTPGRSRNPPVQSSSFYATSIVFPDDADWRQGDTRDAKVVLWRDGKPVGSVPAGDRPDPDAHYFQDGHLWTWKTVNAVISFFRDGSPFFGLLGDKTLVGMRVVGGTIHTLSQQTGGGFDYCINGQTVFSSPTGVVLGRLDDPDWEGGAFSGDDMGICYAFGLPVQLPDGPIWEYRVMKGGDLLSMFPAVAGGQMYDIRVREGQIYRLEERYGAMCLMKGEELSALTLPEDSHAPHLVWTGEEMLVKGNNLPETLFWTLGADGIRAQTEVRYPPGLYRLFTRRCLVWEEETLAAAFTNELSDEHLLVVNGEEFPARFNGYFTGIYLK